MKQLVKDYIPAWTFALICVVALTVSGCTAGDSNKEYINKGGSKTVVCV